MQCNATMGNPKVEWQYTFCSYILYACTMAHKYDFQLVMKFVINKKHQRYLAASWQEIINLWWYNHFRGSCAFFTGHAFSNNNLNHIDIINLISKNWHTYLAPSVQQKIHVLMQLLVSLYRDMCIVYSGALVMVTI